MKKQIFLPVFGFLFLLLAWIPRMVLYPGVLKNHIGIGAGEMSIVALIALMVWRVRHHVSEKTGNRWRMAILITACLLQIQGAVFTLMESMMFENFVFSTLHIQYPSVFKAGVLLFMVWIIALPDRVWRERLDRILFFAPAYILAVVGVVYFWPFDYLYYLVREDGIVENAQVMFLLMGAAGSIAAGLRTRKWFRMLFFAGALALLFVAGEEISWGQRLFRIPLPAFFREYNMQGELTVHNLSQVGYSPTVFSYLILSTVFFISGLCRQMPFVRKLPLFVRFLMPDWTTALYFYPILIYNLLTIRRAHSIGTFAEPTEALMYAGLAIYFWQRFLLLRKTEYKDMHYGKIH